MYKCCRIIFRRKLQNRAYMLHFLFSVVCVTYCFFEWNECWPVWCHSFQEKARINAGSAIRIMKCDKQVLMKKLLSQMRWGVFDRAGQFQFQSCVIEILWQFCHIGCHSADLCRYNLWMMSALSFSTSVFPSTRNESSPVVNLLRISLVDALTED